MKKILLIEDDSNALEKVKSRLNSVPVFKEKFEFIDCGAFSPSDNNATNTRKISKDEQKERILDTIHANIKEFDLLILDYKLFGGDGEEKGDIHISVIIAEEIKNNKEFAGKKMMFISGYGTHIVDDKKVRKLADFCVRPEFRGEDDRRVSECYGDYDKCKRPEKHNPPTCMEAECLAQMIIDIYEK